MPACRTVTTEVAVCSSVSHVRVSTQRIEERLERRVFGILFLIFVYNCDERISERTVDRVSSCCSMTGFAFDPFKLQYSQWTGG